MVLHELLFKSQDKAAQPANINPRFGHVARAMVGPPKLTAGFDRQHPTLRLHDTVKPINTPIAFMFTCSRLHMSLFPPPQLSQVVLIDYAVTNHAS